MTFTTGLRGLITLAALALAGQASAGVSCGASTGQAATGTPIIIGGIYADGAPGD